MYCSLTEAFPDTTDKAGKIARKEERKKAKSCGGPALTFLKGQTEDLQQGKKDPDRVAERPENPPEAFGDKVKDVIGQKSYFGKSEEDSFADFSPSMTDNPGYQIQGAGFGSFDKKGLEKAAGQNLPTPSLNTVWKPLTPGGAQTSFFDAQYGKNYESNDKDSFSKEEKQALLKKLDVLFARLDDLENRKNEYAHTEVSLFILSGLFLLFGLESVRKL